MKRTCSSAQEAALDRARSLPLLVALGGLLALGAPLVSCDPGDDLPPSVDAPADGPAPPVQLSCPSSSGTYTLNADTALVGANSTHVFLFAIGQQELLSWSGAGPAVPVAGNPGELWPTGWSDGAAFTDRALFLMARDRKSIAMITPDGSRRIFPVPAGRLVSTLRAAGADGVVFSAENEGASRAPYTLELLRVGYEAPVPVLRREESPFFYLDVSGDRLVWSERVGDQTVVRSRDLVTGVEAELYRADTSLGDLQLSGSWFFLFRHDGLSRIEQRSLLDGSLVAAYPQPAAAPSIKKVAAFGDQVYGTGDRLVEIGSGCLIPSALYKFHAGTGGALGSIESVQGAGNGKVLFQGELGFFSASTGGGCGGHGNTNGPPFHSYIGCFRP